MPIRRVPIESECQYAGCELNASANMPGDESVHQEDWQFLRLSPLNIKESVNLHPDYFLVRKIAPFITRPLVNV